MRRSCDLGVAAAMAALLGLGFALRAQHVTSAFLDGDELHSLPSLKYPYTRVVRTFDYEGSGLALPLLQKLSVDAFGPKLLSLRLPALVPSLCSLVLLPWLGRRLIGNGPVLVATALLAANGFHVFYSRFARSYGLVGLLSLVLVVLACRGVEEDRLSARLSVGLALVGGLLPWAHLTSAPFVVGVFAAAATARLAIRGFVQAIPLLAGSAGAALLAGALHYPALTRVVEVMRFKSAERYEGHFDTVDVAGLLALGGRPSGWTLLLLLVLAAVLALRSDGARRLPLVAAALLPIPFVFLVRPYGDAYAYARYAMPALPAMSLLISRGAGIAFPTWNASGRAWAILAVTVAIPLASFGPLRAIPDGPFANSYLAIEPLPAFNVPYPGRPAAYAAIEADATIIETPALINRSRLLYRNYHLQRRRTVLMGFLPDEGPVPPGPHIAIQPREIAGRADYLFVHRDAEREADRYWRFVYGVAYPKTGGSPALMERQAAFGRPLPIPEPSLFERLERLYGPPAFQDADVLVFRLH